MVFGGKFESEVPVRKEELLNDVQILDLRTLVWRKVETRGTPPEPRFGHCAALVEDRLYICGGTYSRECMLRWLCVVYVHSVGPTL